MTGWTKEEGHLGVVFRADWWIDGVGLSSVRVDCARGARLSSLVVADDELLADSRAATAFSQGCFAMAPYAGRVESGTFSWRGRDYTLPLSAAPHAAHGVTADAEWTVTSPGIFVTEFDERWPFGGWARQEIRCLPSGIELDLIVGNDAREMPANIGFHPWLRSCIAGRPAELDWPAPLAYVEETPQITSRRLATRTDDRTWCAPAMGAEPVIRWPSQLTMTLSSVQARCWVIHEQEDRALCIEPQTAPGNAFNAGDADVVSPGHPLTLRLRLGFHSDKETAHAAA